MEYRPLGRTGVQVSKLCLGTMMFGGWGNTDHDDSTRIIHAALDAGINFVDTADVYSAGESEEIVGKALKGRRDDVVLATKFWGQMGDDPNRRGVSRRWIIAEVENSLRRLGTDWIDVYQMHRPDPETDIDETRRADRSGRAGQGPLHRLVVLLGRRDRRGAVDRSRLASGALPYRTAAVLAAGARHRA
jgi:aryl-alcohol dehydrogenase-like predicted oxidoreductase